MNTLLCQYKIGTVAPERLLQLRVQNLKLIIIRSEKERKKNPYGYIQMD